MQLPQPEPSAAPAQRGVTVWLTGLPASGKSSIARTLLARLRARGVCSELLDGDAVRTNLSRDLGFSRQDRDSNVARIGFVCRLLTRNGIVAIAALVSPYRQARQAVREQIGDFLEVHVATPLEDCVLRDTRQRYLAARRGELEHFTGVDDPYEPPEQPELRVDLSTSTADDCALAIEQLLDARGYLQPARP